MNSKCKLINVGNMSEMKNKKGLQLLETLAIIEWAQLGMIQRPPDYESGALTN